MPTFDELSQRKRNDGTPVCAHLRTKALHVYGDDTPDAWVTSRSSSYSCSRTQFVTGPDEEPCRPEACQPGRPCFAAR